MTIVPRRSLDGFAAYLKGPSQKSNHHFLTSFSPKKELKPFSYKENIVSRVNL